jgi:hypothetical protein
LSPHAYLLGEPVLMTVQSCTSGGGAFAVPFDATLVMLLGAAAHPMRVNAKAQLAIIFKAMLLAERGLFTTFSFRAMPSKAMNFSLST